MEIDEPPAAAKPTPAPAPEPVEQIEVDPSSEKLVSKNALEKLLAQVDTKEVFDPDVLEVCLPFF
jgi:hypothetical protein